MPSARPLAVAALVTALTALASHLVPAEASALTIALIFLGSTYFLCLRDGQVAARYGLSLGGLFEPEPLRPARMMQETGRALLVALACALLIFPPFFVAFQVWHEPPTPFSLARMSAVLGRGEPLGLVDLGLGHLLSVSLPEEAFYRGYLQSEFAARAQPAPKLSSLKKVPRDHSLLRAVVVTSALFALGHVLTIPHPARLAVFFPSLAFGALRAWTGGVGASVFFHAFCNLYSAALYAGFGMG